MAKESIDKQSEGRATATADRAEAASGELEQGHAGPGEQVQRLARDGRPGAGPVRTAALAMQRIAGNRSTARMLGARAGGAGRSVREVAQSGFQGGGGQLPHMARIQAAFGAHDISGVRSFTGPGAAAASRALAAHAYASGDRVVFADPAPSLHTAAHEAAHVIQQRAGIRLPGGIDRPGDAHERHADAVADRVVRGESAERSLDTYFSARPGGAASPARGGYVGVQRSFVGELKADVDKSEDAETKTEERYALIIDKLEKEILARNEQTRLKKKGEELTINPDSVLAPMLFRLEKYDGDFEYETYDHLIEALKSRGAILIDGMESGLPEVHATEKFVINLLLPGSGDRRWRTFAENMLGTGTATRSSMFDKMEEISGDDADKRKSLGIAEKKMGYFPTVFEDTSGSPDEVTYMIRGPGLADKLSTHPSNSIASNLQTATAIVEGYLKEHKDENVKLRILGHSRNGVTAALLTSGLRSEHAKLEIDSVIFDPVPGGDANIFNEYVDAKLPSDKDKDKDVNSTVIYSLMDTRGGFNPMHVYGAKRLILTHYSHHAGIEIGFTYNKKHYKGLGLLDLPVGLFIDQKLATGKPNFLDGPIDDWDYIKGALVLAKADKDEDNKNRLARIQRIVEAFLGTKPPEYTKEDL